jgi:hypothetical protein
VNPSVQLEAIKTLVALHGQRKAARMSGINENTVRSWAKRYHWPSQNKIKLGQTNSIPTPTNSTQTVQVLQRNQSAIQAPTDAIVNELERHKTESKRNLAAYLNGASVEALEVPRKLAITRKAKDLADMHSSLWPEQKNAGNSILNIAVITGQAGPERTK